jgi:uroporphyrinogen decarboxylase
MDSNNRSERFLKACRKEEVDATPVWLMRQAGRYMKEYREIRNKVSFLTMCKTPELAVEVTLQPVRKLGVDAAILFADILLPLEGMGIGFEFAKNEGPVVHNPVRTFTDVEKVKVIEPEQDVPYVLETIRILRRELEGVVPLIGFSGAPFTLASYIVEGGHSRNYAFIKSMMYNEPAAYHLFMEKIAKVIVNYLNAQIEAGAQVVQIFDSWIGCLGVSDYEKFVMPYSKAVIDGLNKKVPIIHYANGGSTLLELLTQAGGDVIGIDWRINLDTAWDRIGYDRGIQGNLDPVALFASTKEIEARVKDILTRAAGRPGHIFNLGHGILPETPVENVIAMVEAVHKYSRRS